jgi:hypothetical protein
MEIPLDQWDTQRQESVQLGNLIEGKGGQVFGQ